MDDIESARALGPALGIASDAWRGDDACQEADRPPRAPPTVPYGRHPGFALVVRVALAAMAVGIAWPLVAAIHDRWNPPRRTGYDGHDVFGAITIGLVEIGWAVWVFTFGSMVGSFLNVVVHRLPAGRSVVFGRSACPSCDTRIRPRDNVPVVGWLVLGGRCRHCGAPIDARYPVVEAVMAGICLALGFAEVVSGGVTLPIRDPHAPGGVMWTVLHPTWDLIGVWLYHVAAFALVVTWAIIAAGGHGLAVRHVAGSILAMAVLPVAFPAIHPVPLVHPAVTVDGSVFPPDEPAWLWPGLLVSLAGIVVGGTVGGVWAAARCAGGPPGLPDSGAARRASVPGIVAIIALVGVVLGWQAVPAVAAIAGMSAAATRGWDRWTGGRCVMPAEFHLVLAFAVHVALWRWIVLGWSAAVTMSPGMPAA